MAGWLTDTSGMDRGQMRFQQSSGPAGQKASRPASAQGGGLDHPSGIVFGQGQAPQNIIPEPSTLLLFGVGIIGIAFYGWRRRKKVA
ncbi:PEP-CTERM sorting domain-containing protein [Candidatus Poribacteria bacterium]|nr:PEP-CTERM sorting domain-containing protein [Candidatus Poribacteria bacterium]